MQPNTLANEAAKIVALYSRLNTKEKRIYAQGYLDGLVSAQEETKPNIEPPRNN